MKKNQGIEQFRVILAMMVVAIHCLPLHRLWPDGDILITLTLFRIAVPFFFMISGYYVFSDLATQNSYPARQRIWLFIKKQLQVYLIATLLFLPLAWYSGILGLNMPLGTFIQTLLVNGILYHLWYFPAIITGGLLVMGLLTRLSFKQVFFIAVGLYVVGLGGDSWSGLAAQTPITPLYSLIFQLLDGTRNGIFFAPLFLILGVLARRFAIKPASPHRYSYLMISLICLLLESYLLHHFTTPKHDSMYIFLPFVLLFLFPIIQQWQAPMIWKQAGRLSLWLYLLHPYTIAVTHFLSQKLPLLQNNLINFFVVLGLTIGLIYGLFALQKLFPFPKKTPLHLQRATKEFSAPALLHNLQEIKRLIPAKTKVMAVVKADAYGCDAKTVASTLERAGVDFFAVATIEEAIELRRAGIKSRLLILGYTSAQRAKELNRYSLIQTIVSEAHGQALARTGIPIECHLAVDTGMHRLGVAPDLETVRRLYALPSLKITGIFSHLGSSDQLDTASILRTQAQIICFDDLLAGLSARNIAYGLTHLQSSYGILNYPEKHYDYVRPGILLTGSLSVPNEPTKQKINVQPILTLKALLVDKKTVAAGEAIGYGLATVFDRPTTIGIVSIGYCDGVPRALSNQGFQLSYQGVLLPQVGLICMDMLLIDLTDYPELAVESWLEVISDWTNTADQAQTIPNELISRLGSRVPSMSK
ncbi:membrane-bound serine racemase VanT [Enterococcus casseliflavus]|uniref:membrane-bound serine racemase VanT n=1 Tax=unclassified Enterococcus TaxID=2608891 RepID=UPI000B3EAEF4|nr:membrane-bound serine racemase VanT [Enterococcus sp. 8E11_MSG4843]MBO1097792.1 membrane-bound serine racemase VanT [Enterococcus casseliflavus]MBO1143586.1 membrane-bound serine racemase VanT [Enterococcus casseliflavus]MBV6371451.1 membrane-bound serine racemase VanT [Enterococcus casseliflavus]OUZ37135.1 alanine racemase [Enterococcus sp. 8E11_MSG4843]